MKNPGVILAVKSLRSENPPQPGNPYAFFLDAEKKWVRRIFCRNPDVNDVNPPGGFFDDADPAVFDAYAELVREEPPAEDRVRVEPKLTMVRQSVALLQLARAVYVQDGLKNLEQVGVTKEQIKQWTLDRIPGQTRGAWASHAIPQFQVLLLLSTPQMWLDMKAFLEDDTGKEFPEFFTTANGRVKSGEYAGDQTVRDVAIRLSQYLNRIPQYSSKLREVNDFKLSSKARRQPPPPPVLSEPYSVFNYLRGDPVKSQGMDFPPTLENEFTDKDGRVHVVNRDWSGFVSLRSEEHIQSIEMRVDEQQCLVWRDDRNEIVQFPTRKFLGAFTVVRVDGNAVLVTYGEARVGLCKAGLRTLEFSTTADFNPRAPPEPRRGSL